MKSSQPRRKGLCPCGSGKKFKRCCELKEPLKGIQEVVRLIRDQEQKAMLRKIQYGNIGPVVSAEFKGQRIVAVGNRLYYRSEWKTFIDFLDFYVKTMLGKEWWEDEFKKPLNQRSPVCIWAHEAYEYQRTNATAEGDLLGVVPNGPMQEFLCLAYDLYVLQNHQLLQQDVLKRLRLTPNFHGARYELMVAATFVRAGFDIHFENEKDGSSRHPEFIAIHKKTGVSIDVEAKKRNRLNKLSPEDFESGREVVPIFGGVCGNRIS